METEIGVKTALAIKKLQRIVVDSADNGGCRGPGAIYLESKGIEGMGGKIRRNRRA